MPAKINMIINPKRNNNVPIHTSIDKTFQMSVHVKKPVVSKYDHLSMNVAHINSSKGCGCGGSK